MRYKSLAILRLCLPSQHFTCVGLNEWQRRGFQVRQTDILESTAQVRVQVQTVGKFGSPIGYVLVDHCVCNLQSCLMYSYVVNVMIYPFLCYSLAESVERSVYVAD